MLVNAWSRGQFKIPWPLQMVDQIRFHGANHLCCAGTLGGSRVAQLRPFKTPERLALEGALLMIHPSFSMMLRVISHWNLLLKDDFPSGNS